MRHRAVPDKIFEVAEGGLTDGEPHIYLFGKASGDRLHYANILYQESYSEESCECSREGSRPEGQG